MTDAHIRPEEYRPQWRYRRVVIWATIFYALAACSWLTLSFVHESRSGDLMPHESASYVLMAGLHILLLIAMTFQYVWGAIQQLKDFFSAFAIILGGRGQTAPPHPTDMAHGPSITEGPDADRN